MKIHLDHIGKKFKNEWIFRDLTHSFLPQSATAIIGPNGSGKSTLLQVLAGIIPPNRGLINYSIENKTISDENWYRYIYYTAPYVDLIEEFTVLELFNFHRQFRNFENDLPFEAFLKLIYLEGHEYKEIRMFSSGMKQRLKLGLAFTSQAEVLMFDEPTTNLDKAAIDWYLENINALVGKKTLIISSNDPKEYDFCVNSLDINAFKNKK